MAARTQLETHQQVAEQARTWNQYLGSTVRPNRQNPAFTSVLSVFTPAIYCNAWLAENSWKVHAIAARERQESFALIEQGRGLITVRRANKFPVEALASMIVLESVVYANRTIEWARSGVTVIAADEVEFATASIRVSAPVLMRLAKENRFHKDLQQELFQGALLAARHVGK